MKTINQLFSMKKGKDFEGEFIDIILGVLTKKYVTRADKEQDRFDGTDLFVYRLPIDVTYHFMGKDNMECVGKVNKWDVGIRYGNRHRKFETPVLVIGVELEKHEVGNFIANMSRNIGNVHNFISQCSDLYWEYLKEED